VTAVTLIRPRHPLEGRSLPVLGRMRRHGRLELLVVLPDGSKRLIPASWTDLDQADDRSGAAGPATLGSLADLLDACALAREFATRGREQAARQSPCEEDNRAACAAQSDAGPDPGATGGSRRATPRTGRGGGGGAAGRPDRQSGRPVGRWDREGGERR
jgi:hypothetical protein